MSSYSSGPRKRGPAHTNKFAFKHNKNSKLTKKILAMPVDGLCRRCHDIIEWKKQYRKYKPLTTKKKCSSCDQKAITKAYHVLCDSCAQKQGACAKCRQKGEIVPGDMTPAMAQAQEQRVQEVLRGMSERKRRALQRALARGEATPEDLMPGAKNRFMDGNDDDFSDDDDDDGDENAAEGADTNSDVQCSGDNEEQRRGDDAHNAEDEDDDPETAAFRAFLRAKRRAAELGAAVVASAAQNAALAREADVAVEHAAPAPGAAIPTAGGAVEAYADEDFDDLGDDEEEDDDEDVGDDDGADDDEDGEEEEEAPPLPTKNVARAPPLAKKNEVSKPKR